MFPPPVDRVSFWLGFAAASLFWWLFNRIRPLLPGWREQLQQAANTLRQQNLSGVERFLRRDTLRQAQRSHIASPLFALDEIVIQPWLLAPPLDGDAVTHAATIPIAAHVIPYLPDFPEITSQVSVPRITPLQAIQHGRSIAVLGQPGSGKTVALAHLAAQLSRGGEQLGALRNAVPVFLHILDLNTKLDKNSDPLAPVLQAASRRASPVVQMQYGRFLRAVLQDRTRRCVLLLDGLDEISPDAVSEASAYLTALLNKYPRLQIVAAVAPAYIDGLTRTGLFPLSLCGWSRSQRDELVDRWCRLWETHVQPKITKQEAFRDMEPFYFRAWLQGENFFFTPLEWTLRLWSAYAGDVRGYSSRGILAQHIIRSLPDPGAVHALGEAARHMVISGVSSLKFDAIEKLVSKALSGKTGMQPVPVTAAPPQVEERDGDTTPVPSTRKPRSGETITQGERVLQSLLNARILIEHPGEVLRFSNPVFLGLLASDGVVPGDAEQLVQQIRWTPAEQTLRWFAANDSDCHWLKEWLQEDTGPLHSILFQAARWLLDAPRSAEWRSMVMRKLVALLQQKGLPLSQNVRIAGAFVLSRDPNAAAFFRQQLGAVDPSGRRAALLGSAGWNTPELTQTVIERLGDIETEVRTTACMALAALPGQGAQDALVTVLLEGEENLRQAAAEALATDPKQGHALLQEAAVTDDLLTRRAAVLGLIQVQEPWARKLLEKISVEDGQWVVRNAAAQAVERYQNSSAQQGTWIDLKPLPPPWEADWLIKVAGREGRGLIPQQPATDILLSALKIGTTEEKRSALLYLRSETNEGVIRAIYELLYSTSEAELQEAALQALWWMSISGVKLPDPAQYGLG